MTIGTLVVCLAVAYLIYILARSGKVDVDKEEKVGLIYEGLTEKIAEQLGVDLAEVKARKSIQSRKSFKRVIEEKMISEYLEKKGAK